MYTIVMVGLYPVVYIPPLSSTVPLAFRLFPLSAISLAFTPQSLSHTFTPSLPPFCFLTQERHYILNLIMTSSPVLYSPTLDLRFVV